MKRRTFIQAAGLAAVLPSGVMAQDKYPSKLITWICPYAAGGNADIRSRQLSAVMAKLMNVVIIVDNKPGAGGNIGTEAIVRAKPDGYVLGLGNFAPMAVNKTLFKKIKGIISGEPHEVQVDDRPQSGPKPRRREMSRASYMGSLCGLIRLLVRS